MTYDDSIDLHRTRTRQNADDLEGQAGADARDRDARFRSIPSAGPAGYTGPHCDDSDPAEWAGEPSHYPE